MPECVYGFSLLFSFSGFWYFAPCTNCLTCILIDCRIHLWLARDWGITIFLPDLSENFNHSPLGLKRLLRTPHVTSSSCCFETEAQRSPVTCLGSHSLLVVKVALRLLGPTWLSFSLTFHYSHLFAINTCFLSWPRMELGISRLYTPVFLLCPFGKTTTHTQGGF